MNRAVACPQAVNPNNFSYFILPVGKFINVVARWPGSTHDSHIFRTSNIGRQLERTNFENGVLIGDSGYACLPYLMTPYPEPQTPPQRRFNRALRITRSIIERTFGILKRRFHVLHSEVRLTPERVCAITIACCILHNIAVDMNEPVPDFEEEDAFENVDFVGVETGQLVRNHLANTFF